MTAPPEVRAVFDWIGRQRRGCLAAAARSSGVSDRALWDWRRGARLPRWTEWRLVLRALGWRRCYACRGIGWLEPEMAEARDD